jgi:hypothetical protein
MRHSTKPLPETTALASLPKIHRAADQRLKKP